VEAAEGERQWGEFKDESLRYRLASEVAISDEALASFAALRTRIVGDLGQAIQAARIESLDTDAWERMRGAWPEEAGAARAVIAQRLADDAAAVLQRLADGFPEVVATYRGLLARVPDLMEEELRRLEEWRRGEWEKVQDFRRRELGNYRAVFEKLVRDENTRLTQHLRIRFTEVVPPGEGEGVSFRVVGESVEEEETEEERSLSFHHKKLTACRAKVWRHDRRPWRQHVMTGMCRRHRWQRMEWLFNERLQRLEGDLHKWEAFRRGMHEQRTQAARDAIAAWRASSLVSIENALDKLQATNEAWTCTLRSQVRGLQCGVRAVHAQGVETSAHKVQGTENNLYSGLLPCSWLRGWTWRWRVWRTCTRTLWS
jgi:hypothetical protein